MAKKSYNPLTVDQIRRMLTYIDADCSREEWVDVAMGVMSELGDAGEEVWMEWSRTSTAKFNLSDARSTWKSIGAGGKTIGTVWHMAAQKGWALDKSEIQQLPEEEMAQRIANREAAEKAAKEARQADADKARDRANNTWNAAAPCGDHPYLQRKKVKSHNLKVGDFALEKRDGTYSTQKNMLLIPVMSLDGTIHNLQAIWPKKPKWAEGGSDKLFIKGGLVGGHFFIIGNPGDGDGTVAFCEGYATGAAIREATGWCVVICFNSNNLMPVAEQFAKEFVGVPFVVCGDNDRWTTTTVNGQKVNNPGELAAKSVANVIRGRCIIPRFTKETLQANTVTDDKGRTRGPTDFNDLLVLEGEEQLARQLSAKVVEMANINQKNKSPEESTNPWANEEFTVLGHNHGNYFYLCHGSRQVITMTAAKHTKNNLMELASLEWWYSMYPVKGAIDWEKATNDLMRLCQQRGIYSLEKMRGRGAWWDDDRAVYHFGSHLLVDGEEVEITDFNSRYTYQQELPLPTPADEALTDDEGQGLLDLAMSFRWSVPASGCLLAGFVALAPICGALRWRPHLWLTGGAGCGKSTVLNEYINPLMHGINIFAQGNSTEAGIRQRLGGDARPVLFDESESNNEREAQRVQNILSMVRQASSESQAETLKGSANGDSITFMIRSMFCFASIQVGMKQQADIERLTVLAMRGKEGEENAAGNWEQLSERLYQLRRDKDLPARLFKRTLDLMPTTLANIKTFSRAAGDYFGTAREGDQYGTLLAGCWSLISTEAATYEEAQEMIGRFTWDEIKERSSESESSQVLARIMGITDKLGNGLNVRLLEVLQQAAGRGQGIGLDQKEAQRVLRTYGMVYEEGHLLIANNCPYIERRLRDTSFGSDWRGQLMRVAGVVAWPKPKKINGTLSRCVGIPFDLVAEDPSQQELLN